MNLTVEINPSYMRDREFFCICGYHQRTIFRGDFECPTCGSKKILKLDRKYRTKVVHGKPYAVDNGLKHFHIAKDKHRITFHKDNTISVKEAGKDELKFDLRQKELFLIKDGEAEYINVLKIAKVGVFFKDCTIDSVIDIISIPENRNLYEYAYKYLGKGKGSWREDPKLAKGLVNLFNKPHIEILFFGGFTNPKVLDNIDSEMWKFDFNATKPQDILKCPKSILPIAKRLERVTASTVSHMSTTFDLIGGNNFKTLFTIIQEETDISKLNVSNYCFYFKELYKTYGYKNVEKLALYSCREVKLQQGLDNPVDALTNLKDYVRMMAEFGYEFEKYPKSLRKVHDIASMNYKIRQDAEMAKAFSDKINDEQYQSLVYKAKDYSIITPTESDDLVKEGESLSHCVASYVKDVSKGLCKVLFLRKTKDLEQSVVTIEVRGNSIKQVRGRGNRVPTDNEKEFVQKWAQKKQLTVSY